MIILLFHSNKETREMISFCLESQMGVVVKSASTYQEAIEYFLNDEKIDLALTCADSGTEKLFKYLLSTSAHVPFIMIANDNESEGLESFPDLKVLGKLKQSEISDKLMPLIRENFNEIIGKTEVEQDYCRISTDLLVRVVPLKGDIYIRLSSVKFVKLFRMGMVFTKEDLEKYLVQRKISHLYIKKTETDEFVQKFKNDLSQMIEKVKEGDEEIFALASSAQETVKELINRLGFTPEVQELARENVKLTLKAIGSSPKLTKTFSASLFKTKNYISDHSVQLANIACSIASNLDWPSNTTLQKLVLASLFHDILFQNEEHAKITRTKELLAAKPNLSPEQFDLIKNHPTMAADMIKVLTEVPGEVDIIVAQHHERPDGTGFPRGIKAAQIAPLASVLIIAHDILNAMVKEGENFDLGKFLKKTEMDYQNGFFKKVWKAVTEQLANKGAKKK